MSEPKPRTPSFKLHEHVDDTFEEAVVHLLAVWASAHNPNDSADKELETMDRLGWVIERASAIYMDVHLLESGKALRDEAKLRGFKTELP